MSGIWAFCASRWMNAEKFESPYRRKKQTSQDASEEAKAADDAESEENQTTDDTESAKGQTQRKARRRAPGIIIAILAMLISFIMVRNGFSIIPDLWFPYHMSYEYKGDIAKRRLSTFYDYSFFPDEIPAGAKHVKWIMMPSFLQGSGTEVLIFDTDSEYIQKVVAQYGRDAQVMGFEEGMMFGSYYDEIICICGDFLWMRR
mgnify:CR=1 FL=1